MNYSNNNFIFNIPILIITFNRPNLTKKLIDSIRPFKPSNIYIIADAPRNKEDINLCNQTKKIIQIGIDWECSFKFKNQKTNHGIKHNVVDGINWLFENEEMGIILEDDCEVNKSFFLFCEELLLKYKFDEKIKVISGNFYFKSKIKNSYYFSRCPGTHGWATWRRTWNEFDLNMKKWSAFKDFMWLFTFFNFNLAKAHYFFKKFSLTKKNIINTWDYQLLYSIWKKNGFIIRPLTSLSKHIGWGDDATHSKGKDRHPEVVIEEINFPLAHPKKRVINSKFDNLEIKNIRGVKFFNYIIYKLIQKIRLGFSSK